MSELPASTDHNDAPDSDVAPLLGKLRSLDPANVKDALDLEFEAKHAVDKSVGILIAKLPELGQTEVNGQIFRYYGARILAVNPDTPNYVKPHVHEVGQEPYFILDGTHGEMNTGRIHGERVDWGPPRLVSPGEVIVVQESQVHSLRNTGDTAFDFAFASPDSHLQDRTLENPTGDRMFTDHLDSSLPPHYPQQ